MDFFTKVNGWMFQTFLESVNILGESPRQVPKTKQQKTEPQTKSLINLHYLKAKMIKQTISHTKKKKRKVKQQLKYQFMVFFADLLRTSWRC